MKGYTIQHSIELLEKQAGSGSGGSSTASEVSFDNTGTDIVATNVQTALVEINSKIGVTPTLPDTETLVYNDGVNDVYRKVVDCGALPNNTTATVDPQIENLGDVKLIIPTIGYGSDSSFCEFAGSIGRFSARSTGISITTTSDWSAYTCKMIMYYTKATPEPASEAKKTRKSSK